jgi:hypothetical protein
MIRRLKSFMDGLPQFYVLLFGLVWIAGIRGLDRFIGPDPAISCAYLPPICLVAWYVGGRWAAIIPALAALAALHADLSSRDIFRRMHNPYWTAVARFICYSVISHLLVLCRIRAAAGEKEEESTCQSNTCAP